MESCFPECFLRNDEASQICARTKTFVIGGQAEMGQAPTNAASFAVPIANFPTTWTQHKHHRWKVDASQIRQYGLCAQLDSSRTYWENIEIRQGAVVRALRHGAA
jgi:hypothetical protein